MKLSTHARYALRAMIQIACDSKDGKAVSLNTIADKAGISKRYLEQIVIPLKNASLIRTMRGKSGGYLLAKPAEEITIAEIVQTAIGPINIVDCVNDEDLCIQTEWCECRAVYALINDRIVDSMNEFTLDDLIEKRVTKRPRHTRSGLLD